MNKKTGFYVAYTTILILLTVVVVEVASALVLKHLDQGENSVESSRHLYHPYRSHQLNPDYVRPFDSHGLKLHSDDGFRSDRAFSKTKPDNTLRIITLGGSTLYGIGATAPYPAEPSLRNDETVSYYLEQALNDQLNVQNADFKVEVINAAVTAYTTFHHLVYINEVLYEYEPDLLVFLDGHNDFYYYEPYNNWDAYTFGTVKVTEQFNHRTPWFTTLSSVRYMAKYSRFFMIVERYMQGNWNRLSPSDNNDDAINTLVQTDFNSQFEQVFNQSVLKSYVQIQALGKLFNYDMQVFLQPQIVFENEDSLSDADKNLKAITLVYDKNTQRSRIRTLLPKIFEKQGIDFHDVATIASEQQASQQLYTDYCHLTPTGAEITALQMTPHVLEKLQTLQP